MIFSRFLYDYSIFLFAFLCSRFFMSFRLTHIHDYNRFIAVDLGLYRVRAGIYDLSIGSPVCTGFSSVRQSRKNWIDRVVADIRGVAQIINQAILQAGQTYVSIPDDLIMSFPSTSFISDLITTQYTRADSTTILTMQEIDTMIKRIEKESYERARTKNLRQFGSLGDDLRLVSSTIVRIHIDGKSVTSPVGFIGGRIRLTVLNVFVPSSEFNIIRSIVSSLGKRAISLIPEPLILPKLIEEIDCGTKNICLIDIGYAHTTITILENNEILGFETFPYGSEILNWLIASVSPSYSILQIENIIYATGDFQVDIYGECLDEFLSYIRDTIFGYLQAEHINITLESLIIHGNIFENNYILDNFVKLFQESLGYNILANRLYEICTPKIVYDQCIVSGLSLMASELLLVKKDPLVRILRYVLYQYE